MIHRRPWTAIFVISCLGPTKANSESVDSHGRLSGIQIYWSDGDSGRIGEMKFLLADVDAPETGSLTQRGGARCEAER
ncbi:hypothetical protein NBRC116588_28570 [Pyruvatibacter sp. HU-CL02332]